MDMSELEEVKELANQLKGLQCQNVKKVLSLRNCVDLVNLLISNKMIEVIFTTDGKEIITKSKIEEEVYDEVFKSGGRINLVELHNNLSVDIFHIKAAIEENVKIHPGWCFHNGEVISKAYLDRVVAEIRDVIMNTGIYMLSEISKDFSLPIDFITKLLKNAQETIFNGKIRNIFGGSVISDYYIQTKKSQIRGLLHGVVRPCTISWVSGQTSIKEDFCLELLSDLISRKEVRGFLASTTYIPSIYQDQISDWIETSLNTKNYINHKELIKICQNDPISYLRSYFKNDSLRSVFHLKNFTVSQKFFVPLMGALSEVLNEEIYFDFNNLLHHQFEENDLEILLNMSLKRIGKHADMFSCNLWLVKDTMIVYGEKLFSKFKSNFMEYVFSSISTAIKTDLKLVQEIALLKSLKENNSESLQSNKKRKNQRSKKNESSFLQSGCEPSSDGKLRLGRFVKDDKLIIYMSEIYRDEPQELFNDMFDKCKEFSQETILNDALSLIDNLVSFDNDPGNLPSILNFTSMINEILDICSHNASLISFYGENMKDVPGSMNVVIKSFGNDLGNGLLKLTILRLCKGLNLSTKDVEYCDPELSLNEKDRQVLLGLLPKDAIVHFDSLFSAMRKNNLDEMILNAKKISERDLANALLPFTLKNHQRKEHVSSHNTKIRILIKNLSDQDCTFENYGSQFLSILSFLYYYFFGKCIIVLGPVVAHIINEIRTKITSEEYDRICYTQKNISLALKNKDDDVTEEFKDIFRQLVAYTQGFIQDIDI